MFRIFAIALLGCLSLGAQAATKSSTTDAAAVALTADAPIAEQLDKVERALSSEDYSEISTEDKSRVRTAINRIRSKVGDKERVDQLPLNQRTDVFNEQEVVNTIMSRAKEDSRMVCRRERATGSNMNKNVCMTVAQRREATENAKSMLRDQRRSEPKEMTL